MSADYDSRQFRLVPMLVFQPSYLAVPVAPMEPVGPAGDSENAVLRGLSVVGPGAGRG